MEKLITTFTLLSIESGQRCLKILKLRECMCFIFAKMQRDEYETTLPEDDPPMKVTPNL